MGWSNLVFKMIKTNWVIKLWVIMKFLDDTSIFVGYNPQMMPPPMGPNQGNYGPSGGKMSGNMPGPMNQGYPQYNSHYPQGKYILYKKNHLKLLLLLS